MNTVVVQIFIIIFMSIAKCDTFSHIPDDWSSGNALFTENPIQLENMLGQTVSLM